VYIINGLSMTRKYAEQTVQRTIFQHLEARPAAGVFAFHVPNGGLRSKVEAAIFKRLGVVAGVPDVIAIRGGQIYALELKAKGGRISPAQMACHARLEAAGAICAVATGVDAALRQLEAWGLLRGEMQ
jgi:VRR-NUC domain-containing protein